MLSKILPYIKLYYTKFMHPDWFTGQPQPGEDRSLRDGPGIIQARKSQLVGIGQLSISRDGDRILLQGSHGNLWIDKNGGHLIGEIADAIDADGNNQPIHRLL